MPSPSLELEEELEEELDALNEYNRETNLENTGIKANKHFFPKTCWIFLRKLIKYGLFELHPAMRGGCIFSIIIHTKVTKGGVLLLTYLEWFC